jgi:mannose-1-phosphate guanylyltransferase
MTSAVVLCAGIGSRLRPLTDELAKPLMPVGDRPAFAHAIALLRAGGIDAIGINTHHRPRDFGPYLSAWGGHLHVEHEADILGTAGGVANVAAHLEAGDLVVWNGDVSAPRLDAGELVARRERQSAAMLWVVEPLEAERGTVGLGARNEIVRLRGERFGTELRGGNYLGIMAMAARVRASLPGQGCLVADVALPRLRRGESIGAFLFDGGWDDVGSPDGLLRANLRWLDGEGRQVWRAATAAVAPGASIDRCVVSDGARVVGSGAVRECVILPGGVLAAPAERVIAGTRARVEVPRVEVASG